MPDRSDASLLTPRQTAALEALQAFQAEHGYPPTRAELGELLGVSAQTADFHLRALERKGFVRISRQARGLATGAASSGAAQYVPVVGRVAAGSPILAVENLEGRIPLPEESGADFALRVEGDSMIDDGILDGDMVLVRQADTAKKGDIVVALVGEGEEVEATVKRYFPGRKQVVLRPANSDYEDIVLSSREGCQLVGRVVGVLRLWR